MASAKNHRYTVELRIQSADLDPDQITKELGIRPSHSQNAGMRTNRSGQKSKGVWGYSGSAATGSEQPEWASLEEGISALIEELAPHLPLINRLMECNEVVWWCGHFQSCFDGGPRFSVPFLQRLASFGVPLCIDNYFSEEAAQ
jgi:hypothetical protein